jgi:hypothetical protein
MQAFGYDTESLSAARPAPAEAIVRPA